MIIQKAEVYIVDLPLIHPFTISFGTLHARSTVIVKFTSDTGGVGWGESAALPVPLYSYETVGTVRLILEQYLLPSVVGKSFDSAADLIHAYAHIKGHNFAKCGVESAFWCLLSERNKKPLSQLYGGEAAKIAVGESIGIHSSIKETLEEIDTRLQEGYRRIKVKIKPGWDIELVEAIRKQFGDIPLMVDANSSYTLSDVKLFKEMEKYRLMMIEQPLGDSDIVDHATLQHQISTPICLDESMLSLEDARKAIEVGACGVINIKPGRVGGILESIKIHDYCRTKEIPVWCGGMLESGIGRAHNIALATLPNFTLPADMSPYAIFYAEDLIRPSYHVDTHGYIEVPKNPGLGYAVDEDALARYTSAKFTLS